MKLDSIFLAQPHVDHAIEKTVGASNLMMSEYGRDCGTGQPRAASPEARAQRASKDGQRALSFETVASIAQESFCATPCNHILYCSGTTA
jgi:hypothetical protein